MIRLTVINVGYGDALLLENSQGTKVLLDGGSNLDSEFAGDPYRIRCKDYFANHGIDHLDGLFISHIHEDHVCGLLPLLETVAVDRIYSPYPVSLFRNAEPLTPKADAFRSVPLYAAALNDFARLLHMAEEKCVPFQQVKPGDRITFSGPLAVTVLGPQEDALQPYIDRLQQAYDVENPQAVTDALTELDASSNATSLLLKAEAEGMSLLAAADSVPANWSRVPKEALRTVNVLKVPHHGQQDSVSEEQMLDMPLQYVITTASSDRRYNSANSRVYERLLAMAKGRPAPWFLFQDERVYPPFFEQRDGFSAIRIEFTGSASSVAFIR